MEEKRCGCLWCHVNGDRGIIITVFLRTVSRCFVNKAREYITYDLGGNQSEAQAGNPKSSEANAWGRITFSTSIFFLFPINLYQLYKY